MRKQLSKMMKLLSTAVRDLLKALTMQCLIWSALLYAKAWGLGNGGPE